MKCHLFKKWAHILLICLALCAVSCSDDENDDNNNVNTANFDPNLAKIHYYRDRLRTHGLIYTPTGHWRVQSGYWATGAFSPAVYNDYIQYRNYLTAYAAYTPSYSYLIAPTTTFYTTLKWRYQYRFGYSY